MVQLLSCQLHYIRNTSLTVLDPTIRGREKQSKWETSEHEHCVHVIRYSCLVIETVDKLQGEI